MYTVELKSPDAIDEDGWREIQTVQRVAMNATLDLPEANTIIRRQSQIDVLTDWFHRRRYFDSHIDPNIEVGGRFRPNQEFFHPKVALIFSATENLAGFVYSASNVSGETKKLRHQKKQGTEKNYLWIREAAVLPEHQRHQASLLAVQALLEGQPEERPVTTYTWPDLIPFMSYTLAKYKMKPDGEENDRPFGKTGPVHKLVRFIGQAGPIRQAINASL